MRFQEYQPLVKKEPLPRYSNIRIKVALIATLAFMVIASLTAFNRSTPISAIHDQSKDSSNDSGASLPFNNFRLPCCITPIKYTIELNVDMPGSNNHVPVVMGNSTIQFKVHTKTNIVVFHAVGMNVSDIILAGNSIDKIQYNDKMEYYILSFNSYLTPNNYTLSMYYKYRLNTDLSGFYLSKYKTSPTSRYFYMATTQFEATDARRAFPSFDEPDKKAVFSITLHVPLKYKALSNMPVASNTLSAYENKRRWIFKDTPKMSSYLVAFIISQFESTDTVYYNKIAVTVWTRQSMQYQGNYALLAAKTVLQEYTRLFDIEYPLAKLDLVAIPDFSAGAMENWGLITFRDTALLIDPDKSSNTNYQRVATVVAHELAHQWFGNLVTMQYWDELFLNEGFATLMEYKGTRAVNASWHINDQFYIMDTVRALDVDATINTHPIHFNVSTPSEISKIFDGISYSKAGSCLKMIEYYINHGHAAQVKSPGVPSPFFQGLNLYLHKHAYGNANRNDLWDAFDAVSDASSENPTISTIMNTWTEQPGYPIIDIALRGKTMILKQSRFMINGESSNATWIIPFSYQIYTNITGDIKSSPVLFILIKSKEVEVDIGKYVGNGHVIVKGNVNQQGYYRCKYNYPISVLMEWFNANPTFMSNLDRAGIIEDGLALLMSLQGKMELLSITQLLVNEDDYIVWASSVNRFNELNSVLKQSPYYSEFKLYIRWLIKRKVEEYQFNEQPTFMDQLLQSMLLNEAIIYGNKMVIDQAKALFANAPDDLQIELEHICNVAAVMYGYEHEYNIVLNKYLNSIFAQEQYRLLVALSSSLQGHLSIKTLELSTSDMVRSQDAVRLMSLVVLKPPMGVLIGWTWLRDNYEQLSNSGGMFSGINRFITLITSEMTSMSMIKDAEEFFINGKCSKVEHGPLADKAAMEGLEHAYNKNKWLKVNGKLMADWIDTLKLEDE
eukprot:NODE_18_length_40692_cov_0.469183.p2 type:complete len:955 gc:universal NODE_18_length_40692_cov_0.469183:4551-1687(-)